MNTIDHIPVLLSEVLHFLDPLQGKTYIDATLGTGGHAKEILKKIGKTGHLYGLDQDKRNLDLAEKQLSEFSNITLIHGNFRDLRELITEPVDGILFDLGLHSLHVDDPSRGFSFKSEGPLDMRFDPTSQGRTAAMILNQDHYDKLVNIFQEYGQERYARRAAKAICDYRKGKSFRTTFELAELISQSLPHQKSDKRHPATRIFQALRIAVNKELEALEEGLGASVDLLKEGGRLVAISYHSLEDRIVKNVFRDGSKRENPPILKLLTKKPIQPTENEIISNPRARSARLRAAERIA